jgi:tetratricopeptide (TPR) repeat protein
MKISSKYLSTILSVSLGVLGSTWFLAKARVVAENGSRDGHKLLKLAQKKDSRGIYARVIESLNEALTLAEARQDLKGQAEALNALCGFSWRIGNYQKAQKYCERSLKLSRQIGNRPIESSNLRDLGSIFTWSRKYQEAISYYQQSLKISEEIGDHDGQSSSLNGLGNVSAKLGKYQEANTYLQQSLKIAQKICNQNGQAAAFNGLGNISASLGKYQEAITYYQQSLKIAKGIGGQNLQVGALDNLGGISIRLGKYNEANTYLQQSLKISQEIGDRNGQANALNKLGVMSMYLGEYKEANAYLQQSLKISQEIGDQNEQVNTLNNLGGISIYLGKYKEANTYLQQSLKIAQEIGDQNGQINALNTFGVVSTSQGKYREANTYLQQSLKIAQEIGDRNGQANALANLGLTSMNSGEYQEAIDYYQQSLKIFQEIGDRNGQARALGNLGTVSQKLGKYQEANSYLQQSLGIAREIGDQFIQMAALVNLGNVSMSSRKYQEANFYLQQSLNTAQKIGSRSGQIVILANLGAVSINLEEYQEANTYLQQSLSIAQEIGDPSGQGKVFGYLGNIAANLGKYQEANAYYQQALKIAQETGDRPEQATVLGNLGLISYRNNNFSQSIHYSQQQTSIHDSMRFNLNDENKVSLFEQQQHNSYKLLAAALQLNNDPNGSLIAIERGRARAFSDLLSQKLITSSAITKPNNLTIDQIQAQAKSRQATIVSYSILPNFKREPEGDKILIHIIKPTGEIIDREVTISSQMDLYQLICKNFTFLEQSGTNKRSVCPSQFAIGMKVRLIEDDPDLPAQREIISINGQEVRLRIGDNPNNDDIVPLSQIAPTATNVKPYLRQLHELLIKPIADLLPTNPQSSVIIIPDGALYTVPFAALQDAQDRYLIDSHTISVVPSLAVLAQTSQLKQRQLSALASSLVVGNPDFTQQTEYPNLSPLSFSEKEATAVAQLLGVRPFLGTAATRAAIIAQMPKARIMHFATHGVSDLDLGMNSAVVLSGTPSDNGFLRAKDIIKMNLQADMVVLSACDTGLGKITSDGVIGLSRSFITAGTPTVVVSLWSVNDESMAMLMTSFYEEIKAGRGKAQALRSAMLKTRTKYPNPYFWSSMSLIGEP